MHANAPLIFRAPLNLVTPAVTHHKAVSGHEERMKIALLALPGLASAAVCCSASLPFATSKSPSSTSRAPP
jgi:hypothetical protein